MKKEDEVLEDHLNGDEDLLDFSLDDFSEEDLALEGTGSDEEVIDLVDLVKKGPEVEASGDEDITGLLAEDGVDISMDETTGIENAFSEPEAGAPEEELDMSDMSLSDLTLDPELYPGELSAEAGNDAELDMSDMSLSDLTLEGELGAQGEPGETEIKEDDLAVILDEETGAVEIVPGAEETVGLEEEAGEMEIIEDDLAGILDEETGAVEIDLGPEEADDGEEGPGETEFSMDDFEGLLVTGTEVSAEEGTAEEAGIPFAEEGEARLIEQEVFPGEGEISSVPAYEAPAVVSEERIEAAVTRVVREVVERVARETMEGMAERLAAGTIGALKESIEPAIKGVVQEVAEKSARETMANVAEKVIIEAIDALRKSLETASD